MSFQLTDHRFNGELHVVVTGEFGFETARELLLVCKARWQEGAKSIKVDLCGVTGLSSSGVGTLVLLSELTGDQRFSLNVDGCADDVRQLFTSDLLGRYFRDGTIVSGHALPVVA